MTEKEKNNTAETVDEINQQDEINELNDKYLRLMAEFDNFKKRTQKEKTQIYTSATAEVIEAMLPLLDNLKRCVTTEVESGEAKSVVEGVRLIERQFEDIFKCIGVEEIESVGKEFDPETHNAVMHVEDDSIEGSNIITEEFVKGYKYRDLVIRHSAVKVAN